MTDLLGILLIFILLGLVMSSFSPESKPKQRQRKKRP